MACNSVSSGHCSTCAGYSTCTGGCDNTCNGCTGCGGGCSPGCGSCDSNCTNTCLGTCSGGCGGGCKGTCNDTCSGNCSNCSGAGTCSTECGSGCSTGCGTDCEGACNKTCDGGVQDTNLANLKLETLFKKDNIQNISDFIKFELENRRGLTAIDISFVKKTKIDESKILNIISNLGTLKHPIKESNPVEKKRGYRALALDIIEKAKDAYNEVVPPNAD